MRRVGFFLALCLSGCTFGGSDTPPPRKVYETCDFTAECEEAADGCRLIETTLNGGPVFGGICSVDCSSSDQCPDDGVCADFSGGSGDATCQQSCTGDADCFTQGFYVCRQITDVTDQARQACVPICPAGDTTAGC